MLHVGASRTTEDLVLASSARKAPTFPMSSVSKVAASEVAHWDHQSSNELEEWTVLMDSINGRVPECIA